MLPRVDRRGKTTAERLNRRRYVKKLLRRQRSFARSLAELNHSGLLISALAEKERAPLLPFHFPTKNAENRIRLNNFSFLDNPAETILSLRKIATAATKENEYHIDFEDRDCLDIGPYMVLGLMRQQMTNRNCLGGKISISIQRVLQACGMRRFLKMKFEAALGETVWPFKLETRAPLRRYSVGFEAKESARERTCRRFANSVNSWLGQLNYKLSPDGGGWLRTLLNEVLDNARHANPNAAESEWSVAGFMKKRDVGNGKKSFVCHLGIVTLGLSFSETLASCRDPDTREDIARYVNLHAGTSTKYDDACLVTSAALNDGISRDQRYAKGSKGGTGMSSLVNMMNILGGGGAPEDSPVMTIISGAACIQLKPPYYEMYVEPDSKGVPTARQLFNPSQSLDLPPDPNHVYKLPVRFPGTVIAVRFMFDHKHLDSLLAP